MNATPALSVASARAAFKSVEETAASLDMYSADYGGKVEFPSVAKRHRRVRAGDPDPVSTLSLVLNDDGVLLWRESGPSADLAGSRLRRGRIAPMEGDLVELYQYEKLEPNEINQFLIDLDGKLNADSGLFALSLAAKGKVVAKSVAAPPSGKKRRLLLVHGTFSKSAAFLNGFERATNGTGFLKSVFDHYDEVLAFEHPTLSVSPMLNAFDLFGWMAKATGPLDVIAHSRGGLVTRWFLEGFGAALGEGPYRAILVGSPLGGTSLASPARLRSALSVLSNFGTVLKAGGAAAVAYLPLLAAPLALLKIATSVVSVAAKTPLIDAAVAMIPGLNGQSRVGLNQELARLRAMALAKPPSYFVVSSNFETAEVGWKFWQWFRADKLKDVGADKVFPGDNDLVVDTGSMSEFAAQPLLTQEDRHDFLASSKVHHTNYFEQPETLDFIRDKFGVK